MNFYIRNDVDDLGFEKIFQQVLNNDNSMFRNDKLES